MMRALPSAAAVAATVVMVCVCAQRPAAAQEPKPFSEGMAYLSAKGFHRWIDSGSLYAEAWLRAHSQPQRGPGVASQQRPAVAYRAQPPGAVRIAPERPDMTQTVVQDETEKQSAFSVPTGAPQAAKQPRPKMTKQAAAGLHTQGVDELLRRIDAIHYSTAENGLEDASASVQVLAVSPSLEALKATATVQYAWKQPGVCRFVVTGLPPKARGLECEVLSLLKTHGRYLLPPSARAFAADFVVTYSVAGGLYRLTGAARNPDSELRQFSFWIRPNGQFVRRLYETKTVRELHTSIAYRVLDGALAITTFYAATVPMPEPPETKEESTDEAPQAAKPASFWSGKSSVRRITLDYEKVGEVYVPVALASTPVRGDTQPLSLRLSDYSLNTGVQDAFFKGTGVVNTWR